MSNQKIVHYNIDKIDSIGARINLIYGERSNGKSYQVKHKKAVEKYLKTGKRFILMRRLREEISSEKIEQYFQDVDVSKLTNGRYNCITLYRKTLYLSVYDNETGKTKRFDKIRICCSLINGTELRGRELFRRGGHYIRGVYVENRVFK